MRLERKLISPKRGSCMARGANWSALRTPDHFATDCGGFHRSSPTGGAANGIPLKLRSPESGSEVPSMMPLVVMTRLEVERLPRCISFMETTPFRAITSNIEGIFAVNVRHHFQCPASFHATGHFSRVVRKYACTIGNSFVRGPSYSVSAKTSMAILTAVIALGHPA